LEERGKDNTPMALEKASIGRKIRIYREACGMTQSDLGEKAGVSYQQIQKYENGVSSVSAVKLLRIALILHTPVEKFFQSSGGEGAEESPPYETAPGSVMMRISEEERRLIGRFRELKGKTAREMIVKHIEMVRKMEKEAVQGGAEDAPRGPGGAEQAGKRTRDQRSRSEGAEDT
jgi:transcriptional regulator with XRE-family HTH domain